MMEGQNDSGELDSFGRQAVVNKRFSKAIAAVPRARFQKARPKVPNIKRGDASSSSQPKIQRPSLKVDQIKESQQLPESDKSSNKTQQPNDIEETAQNIYQCTGSENFLNKKPTELDSGISTVHPCTKNDVNVKLVIDSMIAVSTEPEKNTACCKKVDGVESRSSDVEKESIVESRSSDVEKESIVESRSSDVEKENSVESSSFQKSVVRENHACDSFETNTESELSSLKTSASELNDSLREKQKGNFSCSNTSVDELIKDKIGPLHYEAVEERNETVAPVVSDRASKYPQLTSLLSKKRPEPKKDVLQKRRRKFKKSDIAPEKSKMTMADLIYWNPTTSDLGMKKVDPVVESVITSIDDPVEQEVEDKVPELDEEVPAEDDEFCNAGPRLVLSEDGTINIDQSSLLVSRKKLPGPTVHVVGNEETTYASFRKRPLSKQWSLKETYIFYKALTLVGTDFGLMEKILTNRSRRELKMKFKREEKYNIDLINQLLYETHLSFDVKSLKEEIEALNVVDLEMESEENQPADKVTSKKRRAKNKEASNGTMNASEKPPIIKELKKRGRKKKEDKELSKTCINTDLTIEVTAIDNEKTEVLENMKPVKGAERKKRQKESNSQDSLVPIADSSQNGVNKRKRKKKVFSDCYVDSEFELMDETTNDSVSSLELSQPDSPDEGVIIDHQPSSPAKEFDAACDDSTNIEILLVEESEAEIPTTLIYNKTTVLVNDISDNNLPNIEELVQDEHDNSLMSRNLTHDLEDMETGTESSNKSKKTRKPILNVPDKSQKTSNESTSKESKNENRCSRNSKILVGSNALHEKTALLRNSTTNEISLPISIYYQEPIDGVSVAYLGKKDLELVDCVMANEVVSSNEPPKKMRKKANSSNSALAQKQPSIDKGKAICSVPPSFLNYTPTDSELKFSPQANPVSYLNSPLRTPKNRDKLITSIQTLAVTPEQSSSICTSLNKSNNLNFTIPISPELNSVETVNPVMLLAQAPDEENVFHILMYKENELNE